MSQVWIVTLILLAGSVLSVSGYLLEKKPDAQEVRDRLVLAQGVVGCLLIVVSVFAILKITPYINYPLAFIALLYPIILCGGLGVLLGYSIIDKYLLSHNESARQRGREVQRALVKFQTPLGWMALGISVFGLLLLIGYSVHIQPIIVDFLEVVGDYGMTFPPE